MISAVIVTVSTVSTIKILQPSRTTRLHNWIIYRYLETVCTELTRHCTMGLDGGFFEVCCVNTSFYESLPAFCRLLGISIRFDIGNGFLAKFYPILM